MAGTGIIASICVTKSLSILEKFTSRITISSNKAPPPPLLPISSPPSNQQQQQPDSNDLHPIIQIMHEQELGRVIITLAVPAAGTAVLISSSGKLHLLVAHIVVVGLMMGCMAIWNGILFRTNFPRLANVLEQVGISLVLVSLYGLVASSLPKGVSWILWVSGALCLAPFILAWWYLKPKQMEQN